MSLPLGLLGIALLTGAGAAWRALWRAHRARVERVSPEWLDAYLRQHPDA